MTGAPTAASTGQPATDAFCTSSNESRPLTHKEELAEREQALEERPADDLVECVVPADVLPRAQELTPWCEEPGRVQAASRRKRSLSVEQPLRQRCDDRLGDEQAALDTRRVDPNRLDGALAADSARRRRIEVSADALRVESSRPPRQPCWPRDRSGTRAETGSSPSVRQNPRASSSSWPGVRIGDGDGLAADPDLERLLDRENLVTFDLRAGNRRARTPAVEYGGAFEEDVARHAAQGTRRSSREPRRGRKRQVAMAQIAYTVSDQLGMYASVSVALAR